MRAEYKIGMAIALFLVVGLAIYYVLALGTGSFDDENKIASTSQQQSAGRRPGHRNTSLGSPTASDTGSVSASDTSQNPAERTNNSGRDWKNLPGKKSDTGKKKPKASPPKAKKPKPSPVKTEIKIEKVVVKKDGRTKKGDDTKSKDIPKIPQPRVKKVQNPFRNVEDSPMEDGPLPPELTRAVEVKKTDAAPYQPRRTDPTPIPRKSDSDNATPIASGGKYYIIRSGDSLWSISKQQYGDGKYHGIILKANPKTIADNLRPGQKLYLPPLTTSPKTPSRSVMVTQGPINPTVGGTYRVQPGDAGFWGVSKKVYKAGKYWKKIELANPKLDPLNLKPGQVVIIPSLTGNEITKAAGTPDRPVNIQPGQSVYTVRAGDSLWKISAHLFNGDGLYWEQIADANPGTRTKPLRVGQKLIIPKVIAKRSAPTPRRTREPSPTPRRKPAVVANDDQPIFN